MGFPGDSDETADGDTDVDPGEELWDCESPFLDDCYDFVSVNIMKNLLALHPYIFSS